VHRWYGLLPASVKAFYEHGDMVNDVILHLRQKQRHYDASKKVKMCTWVFYVAHNHCRDIVVKHQRQKRNGITVEIADPAVSDQLSQESFLRKRQAVSVIERAIELGSDGCKDLIEALLSGQFEHKCDLPAHAKAAIAELQAIAKRINATADDFLLVYRHAQ